MTDLKELRGFISQEHLEYQIFLQISSKLHSCAGKVIFFKRIIFFKKKFKKKFFFSSVHLPSENWYTGNCSVELDYWAGSFCWPELQNLTILYVINLPEHAESQGYSNMWAASFLSVGLVCFPGWFLQRQYWKLFLYFSRHRRDHITKTNNPWFP